MGRLVLGRAMAAVNGVRLFCRDTMSSLPSILCLHGCWGRGETWSEFIARYRDRYRIVAPDQRGHGLSDKPGAGYGAEDMARDAYELLSQLRCLPAIVVGNSMGGRVAAYFAALYPEAVKGVAVLDEGLGKPPCALSPQDPEDDGLTRRWPTPYATFDEALKDLGSRYERPSSVRYFTESLVETVDGYEFMFSRRAMAAIIRSSRDWRDILARISCPVFIVRAADSKCLSREEAREMCAIAKDSSFYEVSHSDHLVYADNPKEFYAGFDTFLGRF